jgi:hypothetical protein
MSRAVLNIPENDLNSQITTDMPQTYFDYLKMFFGNFQTVVKSGEKFYFKIGKEFTLDFNPDGKTNQPYNPNQIILNIKSDVNSKLNKSQYLEKDSKGNSVYIHITNNDKYEIKEFNNILDSDSKQYMLRFAIAEHYGNLNYSNHKQYLLYYKPTEDLPTNKLSDDNPYQINNKPVFYIAFYSNEPKEDEKSIFPFLNYDKNTNFTLEIINVEKLLKVEESTD